MLIKRIRDGQGDAWGELIARYEGRLLAFVESRLSNRAASEDIVQETLVGFLNALPNYDEQRSLESFLFSICSYKLTDYLRREGRRPSIPFSAGGDSSGQNARAMAQAGPHGAPLVAVERAPGRRGDLHGKRCPRSRQRDRIVGGCIDIIVVKNAAIAVAIAAV